MRDQTQPPDPGGTNILYENSIVNPHVNLLERQRKTYIIKNKDGIIYPSGASGPFIVSLSHEGIGNKHPTIIG